MKNKKHIRLTESDLHRIIKESVNKVLNEVMYNGKSLHGNNPDDWKYMADVRGDEAYYNSLDCKIADEFGDDDEARESYRNSIRHDIHHGKDLNNWNELNFGKGGFDPSASHFRSDGTRKW